MQLFFIYSKALCILDMKKLYKIELCRINGIFLNVANLTEHFYLFSFYKCRRNKENGTGRFVVLQIFRNKLRASLTMKIFHATFNVFSSQKLTLCSCAPQQK